MGITRVWDFWEDAIYTGLLPLFLTLAALWFLLGKGPAGRMQLLASSPNTVQLQVDAPGGGWLVLADTWYPGRIALADGKEQDVYPADGVFRAVQLDAGRYQLDFMYQPASFTLGLALSALAWAGWGFLIVTKAEPR